MKKRNIFLLIVCLVVLAVLITDFFIIKHLNKKLDNLTILTQYEGKPVLLPARDISDKMILVTPEFSDFYSQYKSPFKDGLSFQELINKYISNRWQDHYGSPRGSSSVRRIHEGIDLFVPIKTPLYPLAEYGIVTEVSDNPHYMVTVACTRKGDVADSVKVEYGKTVRILYPEGIESIYTHLDEVFVELGQEVDRETKVGTTGRTGNIQRSSKASHLHLELRDKDNRSFDARHRLHFQQKSLQNFLDHLELGD
ncbi:MAG: M23 family metallopeptidase [Candidatus Cloacimonadales bacterium]